jgi:hypothetical protein
VKLEVHGKLERRGHWRGRHGAAVTGPLHDRHVTSDCESDHVNHWHGSDNLKNPPKPWDWHPSNSLNTFQVCEFHPFTCRGGGQNHKIHKMHVVQLTILWKDIKLSNRRWPHPQLWISKSIFRTPMRRSLLDADLAPAPWEKQNCQRSLALNNTLRKGVAYERDAIYTFPIQEEQRKAGMLEEPSANGDNEWFPVLVVLGDNAVYFCWQAAGNGLHIGQRSSRRMLVWWFGTPEAVRIRPSMVVLVQ